MPAITGGVVIAQTRIIMPTDLATARPGLLVPVTGTITANVDTVNTIRNIQSGNITAVVAAGVLNQVEYVDTVDVVGSLRASGTLPVEVRTTYTVTGPISYTNPPESSTVYIPDVDIHGMDFIDVRDLNKMLIEIDADQPIAVEVENSPTGDVENSRPLAGYMLVSTLFDVSRRNVITLDGAGACVGFIRLKTITGEVAPSEINVWIEAK
jgi:hypothetical protein